IERKYGIERKVLAQVAEPLRRALTGPRGAYKDARLLLTFIPPAVTCLKDDVAVAEGLVVGLEPLFARVDEYLGVAGPSPDTAQAVLTLPQVGSSSCRER